ncbi:7-carboxy-7-deazaguanine synthase QueE [Thiothrix unzii]|uniref:7-carboxy-7-deazaguanine synthase n=1 Tax=Thiothrix unzii TaxID=111769 RepID=A0A975F9H6_9GAMM|nr:7-carboxy-7-deazaguanine synthase QueE [Thiothrix unzii]QTR53747.1 7-carboxy-7-deazaguanine synthase QueE [Thiothrix unzii]
MSSLRITEIFHSLQGETRTVGLPTVFVRLTGCPLRCHYCDTAYAFTGGTSMALADIVEQVASYQAHYVTVTGGEPLAQKNCLTLLSTLCDQGYEVSLETSGAITLEGVDPRVVKVMDIKTPASGEAAKNRWENLALLDSKDQLKAVICSRDDYEWFRDIAEVHGLFERCEVLISPSHTELKPRELAEWVLEDRLPVRFQLQLHKYLWNDEPGH